LVEYTVSIFSHFCHEMEAVWSSEMLLPAYQTTRYHNPENRNTKLHLHENLKFLNCDSGSRPSHRILYLNHTGVYSDGVRLFFFSVEVNVGIL
jgi:hypothetical protein